MMISVATPLNVSCSCTECNTFLQPISHMTTPRTSNKERDLERTKNKLDDLFSPLIINKSRRAPSIFIPSNWNLPVPSPFVPRTPGLGCCTHATCSEQITMASGISYRNLLCSRHSDELRGSVKEMVESWAGKEAERQATRPMKWTTRQPSVGEDEKLKRTRVQIWNKKTV